MQTLAKSTIFKSKCTRASRTCSSGEETTRLEVMALASTTWSVQSILVEWLRGSSHSFAKSSEQYDQHYQLVKTIAAANGLGADLHSFSILPSGNALISVYDAVEINGEWIWDCLFQEIDIESSELIYEWRATEHFALTDSYSARGSTSKEEPYDWFHINMIEKDASGNYLVSIRHLRTIAYISGTTGEVLWRLGGKHSSFTDLSNGEASLFVGQHDAHFHYEGDRVYITFFDNRADWQYELEHVSKGRRVALDLNKMTVEVDKTFVHPLNIFSFSQGSYQSLPNGHVLLGYGFSGAVTEFSADGKVLCDAYIQPSSRFSSGDVQSYRNMKFNWTGLPTTSPSLVLEQRMLYVSWLGATEVHSWELQHAYEETEEYSAAFTFEKSGFESSFQIEQEHLTRRYIKVIALDREGEELAESVVIDLEAAGRSWMIKGQEEESDNISLMLGHATGVLILICIAALIWMLRTRPSWRAHLDSRGISTQSVKHEIRHRLSNMGILGRRQGSRAHVAYDLLPTRHFEDE